MDGGCHHCRARSCKIVWSSQCCVVRHLVECNRDQRNMHYTRLLGKQSREWVNEVVVLVNAELQRRRDANNGVGEMG